MSSIFSGKAGRNAAIWSAMQAGWQKTENQGYAQQGYESALGRVEPAFESATDYLSKGYKTSRADAKAGFGQARKDIGQWRGKALDSLRGGYGDAIDSLQQGYGQAIDTQRGAIAGWDPLVERGLAGYDMLNNAMGLNGQAGRDAALEAFQEGPGYQWNVDQATEQTARAANKYGGLYSGNTSEATTRLASNLANQEYGSWLQRLQPYQAASQAAIAGQVGSTEKLGDIQSAQGRGVAALQSDLAQQQAGVWQNSGTQLASNASNQGQFLANQGTQYGQDQASLAVNKGQTLAGLDIMNAQNMMGINNQYWGTVIPAGQQGMMAGQQAAANRMGALTGALQLGSQLIGGMAGGGGGFGSFLSAFK